MLQETAELFWPVLAWFTMVVFFPDQFVYLIARLIFALYWPFRRLVIIRALKTGRPI